MLFLLREPGALLANALALLIGITARCVVQAFVAERMGDRWARSANRTTLDPRRHFEPFGVIAMVLSGLGWNKPVPLEEPRLRNERGRYAMKILAGPLTNLVLGVLGVLGVALLQPDNLDRYGPGNASFPVVLAASFAAINLGLAVLTLIPLPPLDGARLLWMLAPPTEGWRKARYHLEEQHWGLGICLILILPIFDSVLLLAIVRAVSGPLLDVLYGLVGVSI